MTCRCSTASWWVIYRVPVSSSVDNMVVMRFSAAKQSLDFVHTDGQKKK